MQNLIIAFTAVAPTFIMMALGYGVRRSGRLDEKTIAAVNRINYYLFLPMLVVKNLYKENLDFQGALPLVLFCVAGVLAEYIFSYYFVHVMDPSPKRHAVLMQCFYRSNLIIIGVPVAEVLFDDISLLALVFAFVVSEYNLLSSWSYEQDKGEADKKKLFLTVVKSPLVLGTVAGVLINLLPFSLPYFLSSTVETMGTIGSGMALFLLGASFSFSGAKRDRRLVLVSSAVRLVIMPLIFVTASVLLGYRAQAVCAVLITFGSSIPTTTFTMSKVFDSDWELAGELVVFSSLIACGTLFLWIFALKSLGFL